MHRGTRSFPPGQRRPPRFAELGSSADWALALLFILITSCTPNPPDPQPAFYHWQTTLDISDSLLTAHQTDRIYIKAFDVSWNDGRPEPTALLETAEALPAIDAIPVIFITDEVFQHPTPDLVDDVLRLLAIFPFPHTELQIDCDWTAGTRVQYFSFLQALSESSGKQISCTVRLHQYRDRSTQGIPPIDRAVLMAYNTGDLGSWETENSIVDSATIAAYVNGQPPYPLPLDLAVAVYDWAAVYRRGELTYLINEPDLAELADTARFSSVSDDRYRVDSSTYYAGLYLYRDDLLRLERAPRKGADRLVEWLWPTVANSGSEHLIYYRMGSRGWVNGQR